jgi:hypothetical protein
MVAAAIVLSFPSATKAAPDEAPIRLAIKNAIISQQMAPMPGANFKGRALAQADRATIEGLGRSDLAKYFAGNELAKRNTVLAQNLDGQMVGDVRYLDAGVSRIDIVSLDTCASAVPAADPSGAVGTPLPCDMVTATVQADVWLDIAQVQDGGKLVVAHPKNTMIFTLELQHIDNRWLVIDEEGNYAPGSEP